MENQTESELFLPIESMDRIENDIKSIKKTIEGIESVIKRYKAVFYRYSPKISMTDLSVRSKRCLNAAEIVYLVELEEYYKRDLHHFRYLGNKSITEIEDIMKEYGLKFKDS